MYNAIIVDDEIAAVNSLNRRVDWEKYNIDKIFIANSMEQAKNILKDNKVHLIICDIEMPKGTGLDLFKWIKDKSLEIECIYVTCHPEFDYIRKAMQLGSIDYILKPIDYQELDGAILKAIERIDYNIKIKEVNEFGQTWLNNIVNNGKQNKDNKKGEDVINKVKRYIIENIASTLSIEEISEVVYLNPQYLMRLFKKETNMSIVEYITVERIRIAKEILESTNLAINEVADLVGYGNYSYFIKLFKKITNLTPKQYRANKKLNKN